MYNKPEGMGQLGASYTWGGCSQVWYVTSQDIKAHGIQRAHKLVSFSVGPLFVYQKIQRLGSINKAYVESP